jgi:hypothetical protein
LLFIILTIIYFFYTAINSFEYKNIQITPYDTITEKETKSCKSSFLLTNSTYVLNNVTEIDAKNENKTNGFVDPKIFSYFYYVEENFVSNDRSFNFKINYQFVNNDYDNDFVDFLIFPNPIVMFERYEKNDDSKNKSFVFDFNKYFDKKLIKIDGEQAHIINNLLNSRFIII